MSAIEEILKEFPAAEARQWETLFLKETKQENILPHESYLGFTVQPFYTSANRYAGQPELVQQLSFKKDEAWFINRYISVDDATLANKKILGALSKGVSSVTVGGQLDSLQKMTAVLHGVMAAFIEVNFDAKQPAETAEVYLNWCRSNNVPLHKISGAVYSDPIGFALRNGGWKKDAENDLALLEAVYKNISEAPGLKCITIDASVYHYAGASLVQTITYSLAHALEYLNWFVSKGVSLVDITDRVVFRWPTGTDFFAEMAALRALRLAWNQLCAHITGDSSRLYRACIQAHTSVFTWSVADMYNNLLRATTQAMSAIAGGVNTLEVKPYNIVSTQADDFSERLSANIQLLLREESFFGKVTDPAAGSYLVEELTHQLYIRSLEGVKNTESLGGLMAMAEKGILQQELDLSMQRQQDLLEKGKIKILGANLYPDKNEKLETIPRNDLFGQVSSGKTFLPLKQQRLAAILEQVKN